MKIVVMRERELQVVTFQTTIMTTYLGGINGVSFVGRYANACELRMRLGDITS